MGKNVYIALDCGKANTKIAVFNEKDGTAKVSVVPTKIKEVEMTVDLAGISTHSMIYNGKKYGIGMHNSKTDLQTNSKLDEIHKMMALFAIASNVNSGDTVSIVINCPYDVGINTDKRDEFAREILPNGSVEVEADGVVKKFYISFVTAYPEGISALSMLKLKHNDEFIGLIDIGGLNSTYTLFNNNGIRIGEKSNLVKKGYLKMCSERLASLNATFDKNYGFDEMLNVMQRGFIKGKEESEGYIKELLDMFLDEIVECLKADGWEPSEYHLVFVGGASAYVLKERILAKFPDAEIPNNAEYLNVLGAMKVLCNFKGLSFSGKIA